MKFIKRTKQDKGASNTISFIMIIGFVMALLISFIDIGMYFNVKNEIQTAAENGARNVALYGGTEGSLRTSAERKDVMKAEDVVQQSMTTKFSTSVETDGSTKSVVQIKKIECAPKKAGAGDKVYCLVVYKYNGIAGNFSVFNLGKMTDRKAYGYAVSEVNMK